MSKYLLLCSCLECGEQNTVQSLNQHIFSKHTVKGKCLECNNDIYSKNKFCNKSCSASYNNKLRITKINISSCIECGTEVTDIKNKNRKFCSSECFHKNKTKTSIEKFNGGGLKETVTIRKVIARLHGYNCVECGISDYNGKPITLQVDHKDGNVLNNSPDNLRLLCPNCHSQSENWGGRNKGYGRKSRGLKR